MPDDVTDPLVELEQRAKPLPPTVVICPHCARSLVHEDGSLRLAVAADTVNLSTSDRAALRELQQQAETPLARKRA